METSCKSKIWVGRILTGLAVLPFVMSCIMKFKGGPEVTQGLGHLGWSESMLTTLGIIEAACVVIYLIPLFSVLGAILLTGYLGGAVSAHLRVGDSVLTPVIIGIVVWAGIYFRESKLRKVLPTRVMDFKYEREILIDQSPETVFSFIKFLKNFRSWNPFLKKDPNVKLETRGVDGQIGFVSCWDGNREIGSGEQEIIRIIEGRKVEFELRFKKPFKSTNQSYFEVEAIDGNRSRVRWGMSGQYCFPMNLIGTLINCDKMVGNEFENGLRTLKSVLEKK